MKSCSELRDLWPTSLSTSEIGRKIGGATGDMVCGKAKRIGLPPRDSNQRRDAHLVEKRPTIEKMLRAAESIAADRVLSVGISEEYVRVLPQGTRHTVIAARSLEYAQERCAGIVQF
jgi:hypothetical protein